MYQAGTLPTDCILSPRHLALKTMFESIHLVVFCYFQLASKFHSHRLPLPPPIRLVSFFSAAFVEITKQGLTTAEHN